MKATQIARWRLDNSRLAGDTFSAPEDVVRWHGAMQSQDYGPAKWSIGQRSANVLDPDIEEAVADGSILRTHVLRPTWHFVARDDIRWLLTLAGPRVQRSNAARYRELGLDARILGRCESRIVSALGGGNALTRDQIGEILDRAKIDRSGQRLPYMLMHLELEAVICSGPRAGKKHTYALVDERAPQGPRFDRDGALVELTRRYLRSHGPATIQDLRWWSSLTVSDIKHALDILGPEVERVIIDGLSFWSMASDEGRALTTRGAQLLQTYDELIVGYTTSRFFGDQHAAAVRAAWQDRQVPRDVVLVNGLVAGLWKRTIKKNGVAVVILTYDAPKASHARALETAGADLGRFLGLEPTVTIGRL
ncbi:MAG: winged helix DNA-binding domain-containing protein [Actinomycetota bacterium]|nr:winged helix DNA-binding domain-containing protein [Actinomycetota bacterium]